MQKNGISTYSDKKISVGDIRKTQLITTYGVGAIVDFKNDTVVIASTDDWDYSPNDAGEVENRKIFNENLSVITGAEYFLRPRTTQSTNSFSQSKDIPSYIFPEKLHCSNCGNIYDFRELDIKERHKCPKCKSTLNASRFVVVCPHGHMDDFLYDWWVHNGKPCPSRAKSPRIKMTNINNRTDIDSLRLECTECGASRSMVQVFSENALSDFQCTCKHPHFKDPLAKASYGCHDKMRVRLRSGSGVYFPLTKSALLIPPWSKKVVNAIQKDYEILSALDESKLASVMRNKLNDPELSDDEIIRSWNAVKISIEQKRERTELSVYEDEYAILSKGDNDSEGNFSSYPSAVPQKYQEYFNRLTVVDRLTVTLAFTAFTRIIRNESNNFVFNAFSETYVMLHTFAHLFIREISNICGYSTASIKEKIYSEIDEKNDNVKMCGVLIYVSSPDSDSSLGGLISIADDKDVFENILDSMLEHASWCSGDPLCISSTKQGYKNLNYAACHDCTLLPETSCERFNCFLDRASIVGLPDNPTLGFFHLVNRVGGKIK